MNFLIAVSLNDKNYKENLKKAKQIGADAVEYRIDGFENTSIDHCKEVISYGNSLGLKAILTIRAPFEGGLKEIPNRLEHYKELTPLADFVDIELKAPKEEKEEVKRTVRSNGKKLILSYHNFEKTPPKGEIERIFTEIVKEGADIAKVSFKAESLKDISNLLCVAAVQPIPTVSIAMGEIGKISRIAAYVFNSVISYCALETAFAPGQLTLEEMVELRKKFFGF
jgi:3-dehydroquinate dehydratase-1